MYILVLMCFSLLSVRFCTYEAHFMRGATSPLDQVICDGSAQIHLKVQVWQAYPHE